MLHPTVQAKLPLLMETFKAHNIKSAYAFGSVTDSSFNDNSDADQMWSIIVNHLLLLKQEPQTLFNN